jgi:hypothetical protein
MQFFDIECECGWKKQSLGVEAVIHWVAEWQALNKIESSSPLNVEQ